MTTNPALPKITEGILQTEEKTIPWVRPQERINCARIVKQDRKREENTAESTTTTTTKTGIGTKFSMILPNANGLNSWIKRHRQSDCIKTQEPSICCPYNRHLTTKDWHCCRMKGWEKLFQDKGTRKQADVPCTSIWQNKTSEKR